MFRLQLNTGTILKNDWFDSTVICPQTPCVPIAMGQCIRVTNCFIGWKLFVNYAVMSVLGIVIRLSYDKNGLPMYRGMMRLITASRPKQLKDTVEFVYKLCIFYTKHEKPSLVGPPRANGTWEYLCTSRSCIVITVLISWLCTQAISKLYRTASRNLYVRKCANASKDCEGI